MKFETIDVLDVPPCRQRNSFYADVWQDFAELPAGKALVVLVPEGKNTGSVYAALRQSKRASFYGETLGMTRRGDKIFMWKESAVKA